MIEGKGTLNIVIAVVLAFLGIILIAQNFARNNRLGNINNWFLTNATVVNATAQPTTSSAGLVPIDPSNITQIPDATARYIPKVVYEYTVNGQQYQSNQLFYGSEPQFGPNEISNFMERYRVGSTIPIYYNPQNPSQSYAIVAGGGRSYWGFVFGVVLILLAFWVLNRDKISFSSSGSNITSETPNLTEIRTPVIRTNTGATIGQLY